MPEDLNSNVGVEWHFSRNTNASWIGPFNVMKDYCYQYCKYLGRSCICVCKQEYPLFYVKYRVRKHTSVPHASLIRRAVVLVQYDSITDHTAYTVFERLSEVLKQISRDVWACKHTMNCTTAKHYYQAHPSPAEWIIRPEKTNFEQPHRLKKLSTKHHTASSNEIASLVQPDSRSQRAMAFLSPKNSCTSTATIDKPQYVAPIVKLASLKD